MKINICLSSDNNYFKHLCVCVASILKNANNDTDISLFILNDGNILQEHKDNLLKLQSIKKFEINYVSLTKEQVNLLPSKYVTEYWTIATWYRILISTLLPKNIDKLIYLDCDIVVCKDLSDFFNIDISNYWIAGVEDVGYYNERQYKGRQKENFTYINAGVLLINLKKWRQDNIEQKLLNFIETTKMEILFVDQDVINYCLHEKCKILPLNYNTAPIVYYNVVVGYWEYYLKEELYKALKDPYIIHFTVYKPWDQIYTIYSKQYFKYFKFTNYKQKINIKQRIKNFLSISVFYIRRFICPIIIISISTDYICLLRKYRFKISENIFLNFICDIYKNLKSIAKKILSKNEN